MTKCIYWDSFGLQSLHSGVGHHAFQLHRALERLKCSPLILPSQARLDPIFESYLAAQTPTDRLQISHLKPLALWRSSRLLHTLKPGIVHGLSNYNLPSLPRRGRWASVLTVHDLIPWFAPQMVSTSLRVFLAWQMPRSLQGADAIICVSRWTLESLEERFPFVRGRTHLIPNGQLPYLPSALRGEPGYRLLTVSRNEGYKRLPWIAEILKHLASDFTWDIVTDASGRRILETGFPELRDRWRIHVGLPDDELDQLFAKSQIYIHPSLWEGYCLPAAQAIHRGKPVIYTRGSGIDETVGAAGQGLEADADAQAWSQAIVQTATQAHIWQEKCESFSRQQPSWDDVAARTLAIYDMLEG